MLLPTSGEHTVGHRCRSAYRSFRLWPAAEHQLMDGAHNHIAYAVLRAIEIKFQATPLLIN